MRWRGRGLRPRKTRISDIVEDKEEEVGDDAEERDFLPPKKIQAKTEQIEKSDNGLPKDSRKKVELGTKIEELGGGQDTHRSS